MNDDHEDERLIALTYEPEPEAGWAGPGGGLYQAHGPRLIYTDGEGRHWQVIGTTMATYVAREHAISTLLGHRPRADVVGARRACKASQIATMCPSSALGVEVALRVRRVVRSGDLRPVWERAAHALGTVWLDCPPNGRVDRVLRAIGAPAYWVLVALLADEYDRRAMRERAWHIHMPELEVRSWVLATLTPMLPDDVLF